MGSNWERVTQTGGSFSVPCHSLQWQVSLVKCLQEDREEEWVSVLTSQGPSYGLFPEGSDPLTALSSCQVTCTSFRVQHSSLFSLLDLQKVSMPLPQHDCLLWWTPSCALVNDPSIKLHRSSTPSLLTLCILRCCSGPREEWWDGRCVSGARMSQRWKRVPGPDGTRGPLIP